MSRSGAPQPIFRPLEAKDVKAISLVHHRACMIAYRFINWRYPLGQVERWYFGKFAEWTWTLAAFGRDAAMAGFIALTDRHVRTRRVALPKRSCSDNDVA
jgi:Ser/Thr protein kinase RdoA (MazF antagonist)